jgi:hypothetical protein
MKTFIVDHGVEDKRLLVVEPELGRTFRVMRREGNTLSAVLRQGWDGVTMQILTKTSGERATGHHISLIGHITVDELRRCLSHIDLANGLANRFLPVIPGGPWSHCTDLVLRFICSRGMTCSPESLLEMFPRIMPAEDVLREPLVPTHDSCRCIRFSPPGGIESLSGWCIAMPL